MASIIPGFEYDIFISYRKKDNKYDGWVLLETHEVDASLKEKLKCLIFIPIISQTYCDPKSYAWQFEFCAFNKLAKEDQFGRDIRLAVVYLPQTLLHMISIIEEKRNLQSIHGLRLTLSR